MRLYLNKSRKKVGGAAEESRFNLKSENSYSRSDVGYGVI